MRERMLLVAMGLMVGCGSAEQAPLAPSPAEAVAAPVAAALPPREINLPGWPRISIAVESEETERQLALVRESLASLPSDSERDVRPWRAWAAAQHETTRAIGTIAQEPASRSERALRLVLLAVHTESLLRAVLEGRTRDSVGERGARARAARDTILRNCVTHASVNAALLPWSQHCEALIDYWQVWEAWRAGPVWPEGCESTAHSIAEITDETSLGRPTVVFGVDSNLSPSDEQRLSRAVQRVMRAHLPQVDVISPGEVAAAERAHAAMQGLDGASCAWPPSVNTRLAQAHPRLWSVSTHAQCDDMLPGLVAPRPEGPCRLSISTHAISGSAEGAPTTLQVGLGIANARVEDFEAALTRLAPETPDPRLAGISGSFGFAGRGFQVGTHLRGTPNYDPSDTIEAALRRASPAVHACRDSDASVPWFISARLHIASSGAVLDANVEGMSGPQRIACVERALRAVRFPTSNSAQDVQVHGGFGLNTPITIRTRVHAEDRYASWATDDPRVLERIQACTSEPEVRVVNASVHIEPNGVASAAQGDASDAAGTCLQNALIGSVWPCSGERDVALRLCVGNPPAPPEPVRPGVRANTP